MKIIKLKYCGNKCEYFEIRHLLLSHVFECSNPLVQVDNINKRMTDKDLKDTFPSWCPLEDYKNADN